MYYWNAVCILSHLLFVHKCCLNVYSILITPLEIAKAESPFGLEKSLPIWFSNNKWWIPSVISPIKPAHYNKIYRATPDYRIKRRLFDLPLTMDLTKKMTHHIKQTIERPVSVAAEILKPILDIQPNNRDRISYNDNVFNTYYNSPHNFPAVTNSYENVKTPNMSYNVFGMTDDDIKYFKESQNYSRVTTLTLGQTTLKSVTAREHNVKQNNNFEDSANGILHHTSSNGWISNAIEDITKPSFEMYAQNEERKKILLEKFAIALDHMDQIFYTTTYNTLISISPPERKENGISFVQSGLFLSMMLMALSLSTDAQSNAEIDKFLGIKTTVEEKRNIIDEIITKFPTPNNDLRWRWSSRLVLGSNWSTRVLNNSLVEALRMRIAQTNDTDPDELSNSLNNMIQEDSGGAIRNTFEPDEMSEGFRAAAITTLYFRARWRSAPTVLNDSWPFRDAVPSTAPVRTMRMMRVNDLMRYAKMDDWECQAIEISYSTPGLTLLILVPNGVSLRGLSQRLVLAGLSEVYRRLEPMRIAVTMPVYTLRMTLLLPSKLQTMGVTHLVDWNNTANDLRLSHAVQRIMFWAEPGRNAFKDDGIEWDHPPDLDLVVDKPYLFFVRWHGLTLMNGNFVL